MQNRPALHVMASAKIQSDTPDQLVVVPGSPPWLSLIVSGGLFAFLGVFLLAGGRETLLFGAIALGLAAVVATTIPLFPLFPRKE